MLDFENRHKTTNLEKLEHTAGNFALNEAQDLTLAYVLITIVSVIVCFCGVYFLLKNRGSLCKKRTQAAKQKVLDNQGIVVPNHSREQSADTSIISSIPSAAFFEMGLSSFGRRF